MYTAAQPARAAETVIPFKEGNARLGICRMTAYRHMRKPGSRLPRPFKKGGRLFYLARAIDEFFERESARAQVLPAHPSETYAPSLAAIYGD